MLGLAWASAVLLTSQTIATANDGGVFGGEYSQHEKGNHEGRKAIKEGVKAAIEANDYSLLSDDAKEKIDFDGFQDMIARKAEKEAQKVELERIVAWGDFSAFSAFVSEKKAQKEAAMEEKLAEKLAEATPDEAAQIQEKIAKKKEKMAERGELTEEEMQEKFNELTDYYTENGALPEGRSEKKGKRGGHGFKRGKRGGNMVEGTIS